jgi:glycosyltransferase involved in cell wall biosynthesis
VTSPRTSRPVPFDQGGPLRVIQVGMGWQSEQAGGLNRMFLELHRRLGDLGVEMRGLVAGSECAANETAGRVQAFASVDTPMWRRMRSVDPALRAMLGPAKDELLLAHFAPYALGALDSAKEHPFVVYFHGPWAEESVAEGRNAISGFLRRQLERSVYRRADACIVLSRAFAELLQKEFGVAPERIHVIPGGVDAGRFAALPSRAAARAQLDWDPDAPTVLAVRRLVKRTGVDRLIGAAAALRARVPGIRILIAGDGSERSALEAQARSLGVGDTVRILGFLPEEQLPLAYRAADLTVVPSVSLEGFGLIVPESLAAGTPVLVTPVGGLPETVEGLSYSLVLWDASAPSIADGIAEALTGRRALPTAEECVAFARERYDWPVIARQVAELLTRVRREWTP